MRRIGFSVRWDVALSGANSDCPVPGGAVLSRYNRDPDGLCSSCRRENRLPASIVPFAGIRACPSGDHRKVAATLLLLQKNLYPDELLTVRSALAGVGIEISADELVPLMRWVRRRGFEIESQPGRAGHILVRWRHRFIRQRSGAGASA